MIGINHFILVMTMFRAGLTWIVRGKLGFLGDALGSTTDFSCPTFDIYKAIACLN